MADEPFGRLRPGMEVRVKDTSNGKLLQGFFRARRQGKLQVYVVRFKHLLEFDGDGQTNRGRFKLLELGLIR